MTPERTDLRPWSARQQSVRSKPTRSRNTFACYTAYPLRESNLRPYIQGGTTWSADIKSLLVLFHLPRSSVALSARTKSAPRQHRDRLPPVSSPIVRERCGNPTCLKATLEAIAAAHSASDIDLLMPWALSTESPSSPDAAAAPLTFDSRHRRIADCPVQRFPLFAVRG